MRILQLVLLVVLSGMVLPSRAQTHVDKVDENEKKEVITAIADILKRDYVFPEVASKMNEHLQEQLRKKAYNKIIDAVNFAEVLTTDLQAISKDKHLRVQFDPERINQRRNASLSAADSIAFAKRVLQRNKAKNYGFSEIRILDGNIGYLNLTGFAQVDEAAGATAQAAMNFLSNADALIIDLRQNGGGSPSMIQLITSYLFGPERVHLNNFYNRPRNETTQTWTLPYVPGVRRPQLDVYVLTSSRTFSAAEEFSYNLRNLERATLIGEVTGGGAHPGGTQVATDRYSIWVPTGRAINPITNTNWEGVGVRPHIEVPAAEALDVAKMSALENMINRRKDQDNAQLQWALEGLKAISNEVKIDDNTLRSYVGTYGPRKLSLKNGILYYQREEGNEYELIPMSENKFRIAEIPYFRIEMLKEANTVVAIQGLYNDGRTDKSLRTN